MDTKDKFVVYDMENNYFILAGTKDECDSWAESHNHKAICNGGTVCYSVVPWQEAIGPDGVTFRAKADKIKEVLINYIKRLDMDGLAKLMEHMTGVTQATQVTDAEEDTFEYMLPEWEDKDPFNETGEL